MSFKKILLGIFAAFAVVSTLACADGPNGIGNIKIGMTKKEAQALDIKDKYYFSTSFIASKSYNESNPDKSMVMYETELSGLVRKQPVKASLRFKNDILIDIHLIFEGKTWEYGYLKNLAAVKYGAPEYIAILDNVKCSYRGSKKYTTSKGINSEWWRAEIAGKPTHFINTKFAEHDYAGCMETPSNPQDQHRFFEISISEVEKRADYGKSPIKQDLDDAL